MRVFSGCTPLFLFVFFILLSWFCPSCKTNIHTPDEYSEAVLVLGNGGGFTGAVSSYYVCDNGHVFRNGADDASYIYMGRLDEKTVVQQFALFFDLGFDQIKLNDPGNRYYFIEYRGRGNTYKLLWGRSGLDDKNISIFHSNFMKLIKNLEESKKSES